MGNPEEDEDGVLVPAYWPLFDGDDGEEDDDADPSDLDSDPEEEDDAEEDAGAEDNIEQLKQENRKMKAALFKANKEAEKLRKAAKGKEDPTDALEQRLEVSEAILALREADLGGSRERARKVARLLSSTKPDDLDQAITDLKEEFPELFKPEKESKAAPRTPRKTGSSTPSSGGGLSEASKKMLGVR